MELGLTGVLEGKYRALMPFLDERQCRLYLATEAMAHEKGGVAMVAAASGATAERIRRGIEELQGDARPEARVRRKGGGRRPHRVAHPGLVAELLRLMSHSAPGDTAPLLSWTCESTRKLASALLASGYRVSHETVAVILQEEGFKLQRNSRTKEGARNLDRDEQFRHINQIAEEFLESGLPVLLLSCRKRELTGRASTGKRRVESASPCEGTAASDDRGRKREMPRSLDSDEEASPGAWVSVACDQGTAALAIHTLRAWFGSSHRLETCSHVREVLVCVDGCGADEWRIQRWQQALVQFSLETGLAIRVSHLPPVTMRWNRCDYRLVSSISVDPRGKPLTDHEVVVEVVGGSPEPSATKECVSPVESGCLCAGGDDGRASRVAAEVIPHGFHGDWNYCVRPVTVP